MLYEEHGYPALVQAPIVNEWIQTDSRELAVSIPSIDSIAGDKLTAYAPHTIGIRFRVEHPNGHVTEKQMEVMKQLFDLGILIAYQFLNKRRNIPGGPLFYWHHTLRMLGRL